MSLNTAILIIDDCEEFRAMLREWLEKGNYQVVEAADGEKGLLLYRAHPVPLVIVDIIMPKKEGIETILELRRDFPEVKIIAISGGGRLAPESYLNFALAAGAHRTLKKPFDENTILTMVKELMTISGACTSHG